jgi:hypothetical protein
VSAAPDRAGLPRSASVQAQTKLDKKPIEGSYPDYRVE